MQKICFQVISYCGPVILDILYALFHSGFGLLWRLWLLSLMSCFVLLNCWFFVVFNFYIIGGRLFVFLWFSLSLLFWRLLIGLVILCHLIIPRCTKLSNVLRIAGSLFHHLNRFGLFTAQLFYGHTDGNVWRDFKDRHLNFLFNRFCYLLYQRLSIPLRK